MWTEVMGEIKTGNKVIKEAKGLGVI